MEPRSPYLPPPTAGASFVMLVPVVVLALLVPRTFPHGAADAGSSGLAQQGPVPATPTGSLRSPAGRLWQWGERDELGNVMPLDVRREKPQHPLGPAPAREEILALREGAAAVPDPFEEHRVSPDDGHTQNETSIDADGPTVISAWHLYGNGTLVLGTARSTDGGHVWSGGVVSGSSTNLTDPCVKAAGGDVWYLSYLGIGGVGGNDGDIFVRRSSDAGVTWAAPTAVTNNSVFDDKPYMAVRGQEVLLGYADFGFSPAKLRAIRSTNGGASFDHNTILSNQSVGGNGACPVIAPDGSYYMFWRDSFQDSMWVSRSDDQGVSWSTDRGIAEMFPLPNQLPPGFRMINIPTAAADPVTGTLLVAWNDQRFGDADIVACRSTDGGTTWSVPIRVNDDATGRAQFFPWLAFDPHGVAHLCWYDRREDGSDIDVYYARSTDAGASFEPNERVTAAAYTPVLPWDTTVTFIGDYNAIAANAETVFPCYQDAREGNQDVYVALLPGGAPAGVADGLAGVGHAGAGPLLAAPSVFADRVVLTLRATLGPGGPQGAAATARSIEILGVEGRRIRELPLDGRGGAVWDGRDGGGVPVPAGVYFARIPGLPGATRLVKPRPGQRPTP